MADQLDWPFTGDPLPDLNSALENGNDLGNGEFLGDIDGENILANFGTRTIICFRVCSDCLPVDLSKAELSKSPMIRGWAGFVFGSLFT